MEILVLAEEEGHKYLPPFCYTPECSESLFVMVRNAMEQKKRGQGCCDRVIVFFNTKQKVTLRFRKMQETFKSDCVS